jgi:predicted lipoprotein with Yx(FWY)xxD motif
VPSVSLVAVAAAVSIGAAGCGGSSGGGSGATGTGAAGTSGTAPTGTAASAPAKSAGAVVITTRSVAGLGKVLVDGQGRTLYTFAPDKDKRVTCTGACATVWPPAMLPSGAKPQAAGGVKPSLLGSDPDPSGGRVVTYAGWPLYTYVSDALGGASGQGLNLNGGLWYVISAAGKVITASG